MRFDKQFIEVIGVLGVIASLTFVGMQLLLDRQVALADQYFNRTESRLATTRSQLESEDYIDLLVAQWENGRRPTFLSEELELLIPEGYSPRNIMTQVLDFQLNALAWENLYFQYQQDMIPEDLWSNSRKNLKDQIQEPIRFCLLYTSPSPRDS